MGYDLESKVWWDYLEEGTKELLSQSFVLVEKVSTWEEKFHDYAFVVFPAAKAYEGFLKKLFFDMGFITENDYFGKHFRIGKALNPELERRLRSESVYDKITKYCNGTELADRLWVTWKNARNLAFHWFPKERNTISFKEAKINIEEVIASMDLAFKECKIK